MQPEPDKDNYVRKKINRKMKNCIITNKVNICNILRMFVNHQNKETKFSRKAGILQEGKSNNPQCIQAQISLAMKTVLGQESAPFLRGSEPGPPGQVMASSVIRGSHCFFLTALST